MRKSRTGHVFSEEFLARFTIQEAIGAGGMAIVYRAVQRSLRRPVALKVLDAIGFEETDALARFEEEARVASRLEHPNLVHLIEYGRDRNNAYMVYEYIEGRNLEARIRESPQGARKGMLLEEAIRILGDVARGLAYAHKMDVVHRDLKPANVLLEDGGMAKIADFGLARIEGEARAVKTRTGIVVGTPECMAPEQARGKEVGPPADVYALGIIFYWMLAGHPPFHGDNPTEVMLAQVRAEVPPLCDARPNLPPGVYELTDQLLRKQPEDRPRAADVERALKVADSYGAGARSQVQQVLRSRPLAIVTPTGSSRPGAARGLALGAVTLLLLAIAGWFLVPRARPEDPRVVFSPTRARFTWRVAPATLELRTADDPLGWRPLDGHPVDDRYEVEVPDLKPGEHYFWRLVAGEASLERSFTTPQPARVEGPWPRFRPDGQAEGWLLVPSEGTELQLRSGVTPEPDGEGRLLVPPDLYSLVYPGGLAEVGERLEALPDLEAAVRALIASLEALGVKRVLAAGTIRKGGLDPSPACRHVTVEPRGRLAGVLPALGGWIERARPGDRLRLRHALGRAEAVDRALRFEGHPPIFGVRELIDACFPVSYVPFEGEKEHRGGIGLITAWGREKFPFQRHMVPPRLPIPEGRGGAEVVLDVANLGSPYFLELECGEYRIALRPPCGKDFRFEGRIQFAVPGELLRGVEAFRLHIDREDMPRAEGLLDVPRLPLFEPDEEKRTVQFDRPARLVDQKITRERER